MKISIITITFNSADTVEETIKSVLAQDYPELEYIIVDGLSTDNTMEIVKKYSDKIDTIISEKDKGLYDALNKGIKASTGDIIGILHSDDIYNGNDVISGVAKHFTLWKCDAVYANLLFVERNDINKIKRVWRSGSYYDGAFRRGWMPPHPTFFVYKKYFETIGYYRTDLRFSGDYELMLRFIHKNKLKISYYDNFIIKMRMGGISNTNFWHKWLAHKEDVKAWKYNQIVASTFWLWLKPISKILQYIKR
ncbi:MAG TPA: glycosyltransferase family 2 protein [Bacteroidia bacterium]|nr:glycosyltransferase [Bacteroidota bacterium]MBL0053361.1 glycosyltransferase [Bacteroidota bacterium]HRC32623.1 glycosyltransferase family 2 protein [Bacteroidia bacterium]